MKIFEIWLQIQFPHEKVGTRSIIRFFKFWWEHDEKSILNLNKRTISHFSLFFLIFERLPLKISKKEEHFLFILFRKESESAIRFQKFWFWNFDFSILFADFDVRESSQKFWKLFFSFYNMIADGLSNDMALYYVF